MIRSLGATGLLRPQGINIGIGVPVNFFDSEANLQFVDLTNNPSAQFSVDEQIRFTSTLSAPVSSLQSIGFDDGANTALPVVALSASDAWSLPPFAQHLDPSSLLSVVLLDAETDQPVFQTYSLPSGTTPASGNAITSWLAHAHPLLGGVSVSLVESNLPALLASELTLAITRMLFL